MPRVAPNPKPPIHIQPIKNQRAATSYTEREMPASKKTAHYDFRLKSGLKNKIKDKPAYLIHVIPLVNQQAASLPQKTDG
jgi:hypothetical protein